MAITNLIIDKRESDKTHNSLGKTLFFSILAFAIMLPSLTFALPANIITNAPQEPQEFFMNQNMTLNATGLSVANDFVMSIWVKMVNTPSSYCGSIYGTSIGANKNAISAAESFDDLNLGWLAHTNSGGTRDISNATLNNLNDTNWHLIVLNVDKLGANKLTAYYDNQFMGELSYGFHFPSMNDLMMGLGFYSFDSPNPFCHVFLGKPYWANSALNNSELTELYLQGEPQIPIPPITITITKYLMLNNSADYSLLTKGQITQNTHNIINANNLIPQCINNITFTDSSTCLQVGAAGIDAYFRVIWQLPEYQTFYNFTINARGHLSAVATTEKCELAAFNYDQQIYETINQTAMNSCGSLTYFSYTFNNLSAFYNASGAIDIMFDSQGTSNRNILLDSINATFVYDPIFVPSAPLEPALIVRPQITKLIPDELVIILILLIPILLIFA